jgi:hypothetical protein
MQTTPKRITHVIAVLLVIGAAGVMVSLASAQTVPPQAAVSARWPGLNAFALEATQTITPTASPTVATPTATPTKIPSPTPGTGLPRADYQRTIILLPPQADVSYAVAVLAATWDKFRNTVTGSADDSGIGNLTYRRVIAVNPGGWTDPLQPWFEKNYPGVDFVNVLASSAADTASKLQSLGLGTPPAYTTNPHGQPRVDYSRVYILIPPQRDSTWAVAAAQATWANCRSTIGGSADDAGIGALSFKRVVAINPQEWTGDTDLASWYRLYYPDVNYVPVSVSSPAGLASILPAVCAP